MDAPASELEETLVELAPRMKSWIARELGPDAADVDDATQEALTALVRALDRFEGRSSLDTYAYRIAMRVTRAHRRRSRARAGLQLATPPADTLDPESRAMGRQTLRRIYRALDKLPERRRRAFILCCIEGLSAREAAEREGTREATMRSRVRDARAEVARRLSHDPYLRELLGGGR